MATIQKDIKLKYIVDDDQAVESLAAMSEGMQDVDNSSEVLEATLADLVDAMTANTEAMVENAAATEASTEATNAQTDAFAGMAGPLTNVVGGIKSASAAMKGLLANPVVLILSAIVAAFALLYKSLTRSEEGQKKLAVAGAALSAGLDVILDLVTTLAEDLFDVFTNPQQAVKDLWKVIKENFVNRIVGLVEYLPKLGTAIKQAFSGDFTGALKTVADATGKVVLGVENITDKAIELGEKGVAAVKSITTEIIAESKAAADLAARLFDVQKAQAALAVEQAIYARQIEEQRTIAQDVNEEDAVRIAALEEAIRLQSELSAKELAVAEEALAIKREQNALGASTQEDVLEELALQAAVEQKRTENVAKQKADLGQLAALKKSIADKEAAEQKAKDDEEKARKDKIAEDDKARAKEVADYKAEQDDNVRKAAEDTTQALIGLAVDGAKEGSASWKAAAIAQATVSAALAIIRAFSDLGPIGGAIASVGIGAITAKQISKISKTEPKLEQGGLLKVGGERHSNGGTRFTGSDGSSFEAEKGETISVLSRGDAQRANSRLRTSAVSGESNDGSQVNQVANQGGGQRVYVSETDLSDVGGRVKAIETAASI